MTQLCTSQLEYCWLWPFFVIRWLKLSISGFLTLPKKTMSRLNLIIKMTCASRNRNSWKERKLTESCLNSWPVCEGAGKLWLLPWWGDLKPSGRWKALLLSVSDSPQSVAGDFGMFKEESRNTLSFLMDVCTCRDAVSKCLEQEPARLLPLRAQLGVTALAGFLDCLCGFC